MTRGLEIGGGGGIGGGLGGGVGRAWVLGNGGLGIYVIASLLQSLSVFLVDLCYGYVVVYTHLCMYVCMYV